MSTEPRPQSDNKLELANELLEYACAASFDERARAFRYLAIWFKDGDRQKPVVKGFKADEDVQAYFEKQGIAVGDYVVVPGAEPNVIWMH